jgi:hypothetical protein
LEQLPVVGPKCLIPSACIHILMSEDLTLCSPVACTSKKYYYTPTSYRSSWFWMLLSPT